MAAFEHLVEMRSGGDPLGLLVPEVPGRPLQGRSQGKSRPRPLDYGVHESGDREVIDLDVGCLWVEFLRSLPTHEHPIRAFTVSSLK